MKQWIEICHTQKWMGYDNGTGKKIVCHSKLQLWKFIWAQGECELDNKYQFYLKKLIPLLYI